MCPPPSPLVIVSLFSMSVSPCFLTCHPTQIRPQAIQVKSRCSPSPRRAMFHSNVCCSRLDLLYAAWTVLFSARSLGPSTQEVNHWKSRCLINGWRIIIITFLFLLHLVHTLSHWSHLSPKKVLGIIISILQSSKGAVTCPRSHTREAQKWDFNPDLLVTLLGLHHAVFLPSHILSPWPLPTKSWPEALLSGSWISKPSQQLFLQK